MSTIEKLHKAQPYSTVRMETSHGGNAHWMFMHQDAGSGSRPCFRPELLQEMWRASDAMTSALPAGETGKLRHFVLASDATAFNLGGDLDLFGQLIRQRDRDALLAYARSCVDGVHVLHTGYGGGFRTVALIQGDALGGGLEMALACHTIVAEEGTGLGLPEVLFGLFPGMGAYSFLCKRVSPRLAEKIILEGKIYSAEEMHAMGVVDVLASKGQGMAAVQEVIRQEQRVPNSCLAMNAARALAQEVSREELMAITEVWVDTALALDERSLKMMDRLVKAQSRRAGRDAV